MTEQDSGPDPNASSLKPATSSDSNTEAQELLNKTSTMLSLTVESLASFKSKMADIFTR